jgi:hypothetical protein
MISVRVFKFLFLFSELFFLGYFGFSQTTIIGYNASWKYFDKNSRPAGWETTGFNDAGWASGPAELGYGDGDESTIVGYGTDINNKYITTYFRKTFNITGLNTFVSLTLNLVRDDGAAVYLNGVEILRDNLPTGALAQNAVAPKNIDLAAESTPITFIICPAYFNEGANTIAVEIHQSGGASSDISFKLELKGNIATPGNPVLTREPYLQVGNETAITIRWRTDIPTNSRVEVGTAFGVYSFIADSLCHTTEHVVRVSGLSPNTKYYYRVGSTTTILQGTANNFFTTLPAANTTRKIKIAAFGDVGRNSVTYQTQSYAQYLSFLTANSIDAADALLILGDNAYQNGTDDEFRTNFFDIFSSILKNHKLYPVPGNHDYANDAAIQIHHNTPYYSIFSLPRNAECGGIPSGTPAYYSYNIGNIHFLALDSWGIEGGITRMSDTLGPQAVWVKADLAANTKKWTIAYWHHAPITLGGHNGDAETELVNIRTKFLRILERYGVDMVICGHSHDYERSKLINGYYGTEAAYSDAAYAMDTSSANYISDKTCAYTTVAGVPNHGTVYVVAGSFGASGGIAPGIDGYPHNAMPYSINDGGLFYFEVEDNRLDARFIRRDGSTFDQFTIMKNVNTNNNFNIASGDSITMTSSWLGNYNWNTTATTRSITITPAVGTTNYSVTDNFGCITDHFTVNAIVCDTNTWIGNMSATWENASNWSCGIVPRPSTAVIINAGTHDPEINSNITVKSLTVQPGAKLIITAGFKLDVRSE